MAEHSRPKGGVLSHACVPAIPVFDRAWSRKRRCPRQARAWQQLV